MQKLTCGVSPEHNLRYSMKRIFVGIFPILLYFFISACYGFFPSEKTYGVSVDWELEGIEFEGMDGKLHTITDYKGSVLLLYAGYLNCGVVCGRSMQTLLSLSYKIPANSKIFFYTLDPERDTRGRMNAYAERLGEKFVMIRNNTDNLSLTKRLKIQFSRNLFDREINHTDHIYLIDGAGKVKFLYPSSHRDVERILSDIKIVGEL